jgi:signal transduction histidine kinase
MLLGNIDVARSRPRTVAEHERVLEQVQGHTERLAVLVQDLLQLNALEMGQNQAPAEPVNLAFTTERLLEILKAPIDKQCLHLSADIRDVRIEAPPTHVDILLRNLLENAVKYAVAESALKVKVWESESAVRATIWNACPLPADTDPSSWFEPFYRPDGSRNSQTGGNGLGLAICAAIARANGWDLRLALEDGGVLATVCIPASVR